MNKAEMREEIAKLRDKVERVYQAGYSGIEYVSTANYRERVIEAKVRLQQVMYEDTDNS